MSQIPSFLKPREEVPSFLRLREEAATAQPTSFRIGTPLDVVQGAIESTPKLLLDSKSAVQSAVEHTRATWEDLDAFTRLAASDPNNSIGFARRFGETEKSPAARGDGPITRESQAAPNVLDETIGVVRRAQRERRQERFDSRTESDKYWDKVMYDYGVSSEEPPSILRRVGQAIPQLAGATVVGLGASAIGGPALGAASFAATSALPTFGQVYEDSVRDLVRSGKSLQEADLIANDEAAASSAITLATSWLPGLAILRRAPGTDKIVRNAVTQALGRFGLAGFTEGSQEVVEGFSQELAKQAIRYDHKIGAKELKGALLNPDRAIEFIVGGIVGAGAKGALEVGKVRSDLKASKAYDRAVKSYQSMGLLSSEELALTRDDPTLLNQIVLKRLNDQEVKVTTKLDDKGKPIIGPDGSPQVQIESRPDRVTWREKVALEHNEALIGPYRDSLAKGGKRMFIEPSRGPLTRGELDDVVGRLKTTIDEVRGKIKPEVDLSPEGIPLTERGLYLRDLSLINARLQSDWSQPGGRTLSEQAKALIAATRLGQSNSPIDPSVQEASQGFRGILSDIDLRPVSKLRLPFTEAVNAGYIRRAGEIAKSPTAQAAVARIQRKFIERFQVLRSQSRLSAPEKLKVARQLDLDFVAQVDKVLENDNDNPRGARKAVVDAVGESRLRPSDQAQLITAVERALDTIDEKIVDETQRGSVERLIEELSDPKYKLPESAIAFVEDFHKRLIGDEGVMPWGERVRLANHRLTGLLDGLTATGAQAENLAELRSKFIEAAKVLPDDLSRGYLEEIGKARNLDDFRNMGKRIDLAHKKFLKNREIKTILKGLERVETSPQRGAVYAVVRGLEGRTAPDGAAKGGVEVEGPVLSESATPERLKGKIDARAIDVLRGNLYKGDLGDVITKELIQNSLDSVRGLKESGKVTVDIDTEDKTVKVTDNGTGMSPETARSEFVTIGGSKKPEGASGGFGIAKVAIIANADDNIINDKYGFDAVTVADTPQGRKKTHVYGRGSDWFGDGLTVETTDVDESVPTGTTIEIRLRDDAKLDQYIVRQRLSSLQRHSRLATKFDLKVDGYDAVKGGYDTSVPSKLIKTLSTSGANIEIAASEETTKESWSFPVTVLNNGLPQFKFDVRVPEGVTIDIPKTIVADIKALVDPTKLDYPFGANRESLKDDVEQTLVNYFSKEFIQERMGAQRDRLGKVFKDSPVITGHQESPTQPWLNRVVDVTGGADSDLAKTLASRTYTADLNRALNGVFQSAQKRLAMMNKLHTQTYLDAIFASFSFSGEHYGVNIRGKAVGAPANVTLLNPWATVDYYSSQSEWSTMGAVSKAREIAQSLVATLTHELIHQVEFSHNAEYAGELTQAIAHLMPVFNKWSQGIAKTLEPHFADGTIERDAQLVKNQSGERNLFEDASTRNDTKNPRRNPSRTPSTDQVGQDSRRGLGADLSASKTKPAGAGTSVGEGSSSLITHHPTSGNEKIDTNALREHLDGMKLDELSDLRTRLASITRRGKIERGLYSKWIKSSTAEDVDAGLKTISRYKPLSDTKQNADSISHFAKLVFDPASVEGRLLQIAQSDPSNPMYKALFSDIAKGYARSQQNVAETRRFMHEKAKEFLGINTTSALGDVKFARYMQHKLPNGIERGEAMWAYALSKDSGRRQAMYDAGITARGKTFDIDESIAQLSDKDRQFVDETKRYFQNNPYIEKAFSNHILLEGFEPERSKGWFTSSRDQEDLRLPKGTDDVTLDVTKSTSALKARLDNATQPFRLDNGYITAFYRVADRLSLYAEMGLETHRAEKLLTNRKFKNDFVKRFGSARWKAVADYVNNVHGYLGSEPSAWDRFMTVLPLHWQLSKIALNVVSALRQSFSLFTAAGDTEFDPGVVRQALLEGSGFNPRIGKDMKAKSGVAHMRLEAGKFTENMVQLGERGQLGTLGLIRDKGFILQKLMDDWTLRVTWRAAEIMAKRRGLTGLEAQEFTTRTFETALMKNQATTSPLYVSDLELIAKRSPTARGMLSLSRELNRQYNVVREHMVRAIQKPTRSNVAQAGQAIFWIMIMNGIASVGINELRKKAFGKPAGDETQIAREALSSVAGQWYLLGDAIGFTADEIFDKQGRESTLGGPILNITSDGLRGLSALARGVMLGAEDLEDRRVQSGVNRGEDKQTREFMTAFEKSLSSIAGGVGLPFWAIWYQGKGLYNWTRPDLRLMTGIEVEREKLREAGKENSLRYKELDGVKERINEIHRNRESGLLTKDSARRAIVRELERAR